MAAVRVRVRVAARASSAMADGFLGRWAQRKTDARQGKPLVEPELLVTPQPAPAPLTPAVAGLVAAPNPPELDRQPATEADVVTQPLPLTLQDAQALGRDSDFKPFIARGVDPAVRNAAMKKLFTDPHYNVMDRLDTYIDDYSQSDPLPLSMLRKMASAQFLKLVDEEPDSPVPAVTMGEPTNKTNTTTRQQDHAHTDLRLQPDHALGEPDPGRGTE
jgi:hypothetical protein